MVGDTGIEPVTSSVSGIGNEGGSGSVRGEPVRLGLMARRLAAWVAVLRCCTAYRHTARIRQAVDAMFACRSDCPLRYARIRCGVCRWLLARLLACLTTNVILAQWVPTSAGIGPRKT